MVKQFALGAEGPGFESRRPDEAPQRLSAVWGFGFFAVVRGRTYLHFALGGALFQRVSINAPDP